VKKRLTVRIGEEASAAKARQALADEYGKSWEIEIAGKDEIVMVLSKRELEEIESAMQHQAVEIIRSRVDEFGVAEPSIQPQGKNRIVVQLPGLKETERAKALIGRTARLTFHIAKKSEDLWDLVSRIDEELGTGIQTYLGNIEEISGMSFAVQDSDAINAVLEEHKEGIAGIIPEGCRFAFGKAVEDKSGSRYQGLYLIKKKPELGGELLKDAYVGYQQMLPVVHIQFNRRGALLFERVTAANIKEPLAIVLDGIVQSAPIIEEKIPRTSTGFIRGRFTPEEANDLSIMLRAGALPASISVEFEQTVGPSLGRDSVQKGVKAAVVGTLFVLIFMAIYYLLCGLLANFALCLNLIIMLGALAGLGATLTLPGIAGIILTMGMSVDANVIIFERIREEMRSGKTIRASIAGGYNKAFHTILDANVTTLIAAMVLFQFGTGPIRGFAVTLSLGIIGSMFTAIVVTRLVLDLLSGRRKFSRLLMLQLIRRSNVRFVERRRIAFALSLLVIVVGATFTIMRGSDNFGIDFRGGTLLLRSFKESVPIERVRESLSRIGLEKSILQQFDDGKGIIIRSEGESQTAGQIDDGLREEFGGILNNPEKFGQTSFVGPVVGKDLSRQARLAILFSLIGIVIYISWRFEFRFAIAAIAALMHDVLITVGIFSFTGREITLPVIAAILTIIGYSLNDTIVVFDRIRENRRLLRKESFMKIVDLSINQTLSRTVLTSFTTLIVVTSLFIFGGEVIHDFAFAILVGIIVGTYSSIFVASPILVEWYRKGGKK
jgi:SecD/SecF fusion protein